MSLTGSYLQIAQRFVHAFNSNIVDNFPLIKSYITRMFPSGNIIFNLWVISHERILYFSQ